MLVKPYGDTTGDGAMQLSFTLPVPAGGLAREAARRLCDKMGLDDAAVVFMRDLGDGYTFCVVYGKCRHSVELDECRVPEVEAPAWDLETINAIIRERLGRKLVVVGACTGTDAHTVGLDAIMNAKGFHGDYGLERYPEIEAHNLGAQVPNAVLVERARAVGADAILVSQVVTQKNVHLDNLTQLVEMLEAEGLRDRFLLLCGGPRLSHELAVELGYDAGFGPGTVASQVAAYVVQSLLQRQSLPAY